ncbi:MAG: hypothetical protein IE886_01505 [Campylobacterales bacterium]|nr:hypothetical protein [Campylobacterales bacterium]
MQHSEKRDFIVENNRENTIKKSQYKGIIENKFNQQHKNNKKKYTQTYIRKSCNSPPLKIRHSV